MFVRPTPRALRTCCALRTQTVGRHSPSGKMVKSQRNIVPITLIILIAIIVSACSLDTNIPNAFDDRFPDELQDISILTSQPCKAPCWYNLTPDQSSEQEALEVLGNLTFIDSTSIRSQNANWWGETFEETVPATLILANCVQPSDKLCVEILIVDNKVKYISLSPNYGLTFDDVVELLGNPDYISASPYGVECLGCTLKFSWLKPPLEIAITRVDRRCSAGYRICQAIWDGGKIPHDLQVEEITYLGSVPSYRQTPVQDYDRPWPGFADQ